MNVSGSQEKIGGILSYAILVWFAWHSLVICGLPMLGVEAPALAAIIGTWPETPWIYAGGVLVSLSLWVAVFARNLFLAASSVLAYGFGISIIAALAFVEGRLQIGLLYGGFALLGVSAAAAMFASRGRKNADQ